MGAVAVCRTRKEGRNTGEHASAHTKDDLKQEGEDETTADCVCTIGSSESLLFVVRLFIHDGH